MDHCAMMACSDLEQRFYALSICTSKCSHRIYAFPRATRSRERITHLAMGRRSSAFPGSALHGSGVEKNFGFAVSPRSGRGMNFMPNLWPGLYDILIDPLAS